MGAIVLVAFVAQAWDENFEIFIDHPMLVKFFVYKLDYQNLARYPGIEADEKVILHDNGVVSYARAVGNDVVIRVGQFREGQN